MKKQNFKSTLSVMLCLILLMTTIGFTSTVAAADKTSLPLVTDTQNTARENYELLRAGKYYAGELIEKFHELFGDQYTAEYIRENYTSIFDIAPDEIDEGILNILANPYHSEEMHDTVPNNLTNTITDSPSNVNRMPLENEDSFLRPDPVAYPDPPQNMELPVPEFIAVEETVSEEQGVLPPSYPSPTSELPQESDIPALAPERGEAAPVSEDTPMASPTYANNGYTSISLVSTTNNSVTFDIWYTNNTNPNNYLLKVDTYNNANTFLLGQGQPAANSQRYTATGLNTCGVYMFRASTYDTATASWKDSDIMIETGGAVSSSLSVSNLNSTSMTVNMTFRSNYAWGNLVQYWNGFEWLNIGPASPYGKSGTYQISGLTPGISYKVFYRQYNYLEGYWYSDVAVLATPPLPAENMQTYSKSNMDFQFDLWFANLFTGTRRDQFLDKVNAAYTTEWNMVGGDKPYGGAKMQFNTSRTMNGLYEGLAGQPITWSIYSTLSQIATHQVLKMNRENTFLTEAPIHEIGHNFDKASWTFEPEALTILKIYQYMKLTGETMSVSNISNTIVGTAGFKTYMKSQANRMLGEINYDTAMAAGVYSPYSLAYRLALISDQTGWSSFQQAFQYIDSLPYKDAPTTNIGKFNLFLTKIKEYSGVDVIASFTAAEKTIFGAKLGGTIQYTPLKLLNLTRIQQEQTNWCWAATAEMIVKYMNPASTVTQTEIVIHNFGDDRNEGVYVGELASAINYASNNSLIMDYNLIPNLRLSFNEHISNIDENKPIAMRLGWFDGSLYSLTNGHFLVISGYNTVDNTQRLEVVDPFGSTSTQYYSYSVLINGGLTANGNGKYSHSVWIYDVSIALGGEEIIDIIE